MKILVKSYTEKEYTPIPKLYLSNEEYARGLQCFVPACTDIVPVDFHRRVFYLAQRISKPMTGWWWIGGKINPSETKEEATLRNFKREAGLDLPQNRFKLSAIFDYRCKDREQIPQEIGCHMLAYTYILELTEEEIVSISGNLSQGEYKDGSGLTPFTREQMVQEGVFQSILDLYDAVFAPEVLYHVVLISFKNDAPTSIRDDVYERYQTLADDCGGYQAGIFSWKVEKNMDLRKNVHLVEIATFRDNEALQAFRNHPKHRELTDILRTVADWQVGDIIY